MLSFIIYKKQKKKNQNLLYYDKNKRSVPNFL
jgi:hypothetical protein